MIKFIFIKNNPSFLSRDGRVMQVTSIMGPQQSKLPYHVSLMDAVHFLARSFP